MECRANKDWKPINQKAAMINKLTYSLACSYEQTIEFVFNFRNNPDHIYSYADFHGMQKQRTIKVLGQRLAELKDALIEGTIEPNFKNGEDHIY